VADGVVVQAVIPKSSGQGVLERAHRLFATQSGVEPRQTNAGARGRLDGFFAQDTGPSGFGGFEHLTKSEE